MNGAIINCFSSRNVFTSKIKKEYIGVGSIAGYSSSFLSLFNCTSSYNNFYIKSGQVGGIIGKIGFIFFLFLIFFIFFIFIYFFYFYLFFIYLFFFICQNKTGFASDIIQTFLIDICSSHSNNFYLKNFSYVGGAFGFVRDSRIANCESRENTIYVNKTSKKKLFYFFLFYFIFFIIFYKNFFIFFFILFFFIFYLKR